MIHTITTAIAAFIIFMALAAIVAMVAELRDGHHKCRTCGDYFFGTPAQGKLWALNHECEEN